MSFKQWLRKAFAPWVRNSRASCRVRSRQPLRQRCVPRLEWLEARLAPAILMVTSAADSGTGSLRDAIVASVNHTTDGLGQTGTGSDTIRFAPTLDGKTISLTTFLNDGSVPGPSAFRINNTTSLTIDGETGLTQGITIERSRSAVPFRLFANTGSLVLEGLTIKGFAAQGGAGGTGDVLTTGGGAAGLGGAIFNSGFLALQDSTLTGNTAQGGAGGNKTNVYFNDGIHGYSRYSSDSGSGGGGLGSAGMAPAHGDFQIPGLYTGPSNRGGYGGGPNGGAGGKKLYGAGNGGGYGGGGGGGYTAAVSFVTPQNVGGAGGFGGGGGGGGYTDYLVNNIGWNGGNGGFGGGGGGGAPGSGVGHTDGTPGSGGFAGGNAVGELGGGGAGMGGAVFNNGGTVVITNSTLTGNAAHGGAGGAASVERILTNGNGIASITTVTPTAHGAAGQELGGGVFSYGGTVTVTNSTFSLNTADQDGRGVFLLGTQAAPLTATINNTIIGQSDTNADDLAVVAAPGFASVSGDRNLIRTTAVLGATLNLSNTLTADPRLGPLQYNGGWTPTMALLAGSPAIDAGTSVGAPTTDQRGASRDPVNTGPVDIGAYEAHFALTMTVNTADDETESSASSKLSLREAIDLANGTLSQSALTALQKAQVQKQLTTSTSSQIIINFDPNLYGSTLALSTVGDTRVGPSAFLVNSGVAIDGPSGPNGITLSAAGTTMRLFDVTRTGNLTLQNLTLRGGTAQGHDGGAGDAGGAGGGSAGLGGAIFNEGSLTILNSTLTGNTAQGGNGGRYQIYENSLGGAGGAGLLAGGEDASGDNGSAGGGPNGGNGRVPSDSPLLGTFGGFGGGGGGGYGNVPFSPGTDAPAAGGAGGGFGGGGGGGGGDDGHVYPTGGYGGFGGGGGGGGANANSDSGLGGAGGVSLYGGGSGSLALRSGGLGGGGAGMGGAIFNEAGTVIITNSTLTGNEAFGGAGGWAQHGRYNGTNGQGLGGALFNHNGTITVADSTFSSNTANEGGRDIFNLGDSVGNSTASTTATATINNTILGQTDTTGEDFTGKSNGTGTNTTSGAGNLIRTQSGFAGSSSDADPELGPLQDNGGPVQTILPALGSPAVNIGAFPLLQSQTITFSPLPSATYGDADFTISATATSGLPVSFIASGNASVYQDANDVWHVHITGAGSASITAQRAADDTFAAAQDVAQVLTISAATPIVSVTDAGGVYTGNPFSAVGTALDANGTTPVGGSFSYFYFSGPNPTGTPLPGAPTNAGTYTVVANFTSSDTNYSNGSAQTTFTISAATPTVSVTDAGGTYTGKPFSAVGTALGVNGTTPVSGNVTFTYYSGSTASGTPLPGAPSNTGTYTVVASFTSGDPNYTNDSAQTTFTISAATPTVSVTDAGGTYTGNPFPASATAVGVDGTTPVSGNVTFTYYVGAGTSGTNLGSTTPSDSGTYTVVASFTSSDPNYTNGTAQTTFTIGAATPTVSVTDAGGTYTGNPFPASATIVGVDGTLPVSGNFTFTYYVGMGTSGTNLGSTAPSNAGTYTVVASFTSGDPNYSNGTAQTTFTIQPASTTTTASNATVSFDTGTQSVTLTAEVTSNGVAVNEGTVTFTIEQGGTVIGTATTSGTVHDGQARVLYVLPAGTAAGTYTIDAVYNPGTDFITSSDTTHTLTVAQATAAIQFTHVSTVPNLLALNQTETIAVHVSGSGGVVNQGTVTFTMNGYSVSVAVDGNGDATAQLTLPLLTAGVPQSIQAAFSGPNRSPATASQTTSWGLMDALLPSVTTFAADGSHSTQSYLMGLPLLDLLYSSSGQLMKVVFGPNVLSWDFHYFGSVAVVSLDGVWPVAIAVSTPQGLFLQAL